MLNSQISNRSLQSFERPKFKRQIYPGVQSLSPYLLISQLKELWPEVSKEFCCVFQYQKDLLSQTGANTESFCAIGAAAEIRVSLKKIQIEYQFKIENTIIFTRRISHPDNSLSYTLLFENLSMVVEKAKQKLGQYFEFVDEDLAALHFFGGWKSSQAFKENKEIAIFTLPKMTIHLGERIEIGSFLDSHYPTFFEEQINFSQSVGLFNPLPLHAYSIEDTSNKSEYIKNLKNILATIDNSGTSKVVLSTKKSICLRGSPPDPIQLSSMLASRYGQVYDYCFQWNAGTAWIGVSPEVHLQKLRRHLITKPLAGTIKVNKIKNPPSMIADFLKDPKENLEHQLAVKEMLMDLKNVCEYETWSIPSKKNLLHLSYACHMKSEIYGYLKEGVDSFEILRYLYPPPTIWGVPKDWGGQIIQQFEPFERDFFTGCLGYFTGKDDSNFALVLRSGRLEGNRLDIFAGSGIVKDSVPQLEWEETQNKMKPLLSLIQLNASP